MSLSILFMDGFEQYCPASQSSGAMPTPRLWTTSAGNPLIGTTYGRFGSIGAHLYNGEHLDYGASLTTAGIGAAVLVTSTAQTCIFVFADATGATQGYLAWNANGSVSVYRSSGTTIGNITAGSTGTLLGTSAAGVMGNNAFHHVECQYSVSPTAGTADVWIDGINVLSLSGLNTRGSTTVGSVVGSVALYAIGVGGTVYNTYDDVYVYDAAARTGTTGGTFEHIGDKRVQTLFPSGAGTGDVGAFTQVGGTGGSPYTAVNERPANGDTSYVADATAGDIKSFALDDLAAGTTGVVAIAPTAVWEKDDATTRTCAGGIRNSSTNAFGATRGSALAYAYTQDILTTDATGAALSVANVNAMELLFKVVS